MEKLKLHSPDLTQENIARIRELFPGCVTEARGKDGNVKLVVDFDQLRQELSDSLVEGPQERYHLNWPGKREALLTANAPIAKTLRPCRAESVDFDTTKNLFIEGDNLDALKLLQETYLGKVKMIYIDPPYNTGNDFLYQDDFADSSQQYFVRSNQEDKAGNRLLANLEVNGRFHSDWLSMMYSRLKLARTLLSDDGVIFVSIDDNEASNLLSLMNEVFGEENRLVTHFIQVRYGSKTLAEKNDYQKLLEQVLVYGKKSHSPIKPSAEYSIDKFCWNISVGTACAQIQLGGRRVEVFAPDQWTVKKTRPSLTALKETWATGTVLLANASGKFFGTYLAPRKDIDGLGSLYKVYGIGEDGLGYRYFTGPQRESATKGKFYSGVPSVRVSELESGSSLKFQPIPNFSDFAASFGNCRHEGDVDFRSGKKPVAFLKWLINQAVRHDESALILDFFGGSCSTAHAVLSLNSDDGGNRRFIMVQLSEACDLGSESRSAGFKTISELGMERIRRAGKKIRDEGKLLSNNLDTGFRVLKIDTSNFSDVYYAPDKISQEMLDVLTGNIKPDRTAEDLLFQIMLDWGVDLALPITQQTIQGKVVFFVDHDALAACFDTKNGVDESFVKELATYKPLRVVFRDAGFRDSAAKINVEQIFKLLSPATEVKCI
jgi:adenine-specific DNA-methyltransferase